MGRETKFRVVLVTCATLEEARKIARGVVEKRLAACVNIVERVVSIYRWEDRVAEDGEQLLLIKTTDMRVDALREELFRLHPYDVPEFVVLPIESTSEAYGAWLLESV